MEVIGKISLKFYQVTVITEMLHGKESGGPSFSHLSKRYFLRKVFISGPFLPHLLLCEGGMIISSTITLPIFIGDN